MTTIAYSSEIDGTWSLEQNAVAADSPTSLLEQIRYLQGLAVSRRNRASRFENTRWKSPLVTYRMKTSGRFKLLYRPQARARFPLSCFSSTFRGSWDAEVSSKVRRSPWRQLKRILAVLFSSVTVARWRSLICPNVTVNTYLRTCKPASVTFYKWDW